MVINNHAIGRKETIVENDYYQQICTWYNQNVMIIESSPDILGTPH